MITLFQFAPAWGRIPSIGQFCVKLETYLRMVGLPFEIAAAQSTDGPSMKLPFIRDGERTIADSEVILDYLRSAYGDSLDAELTPRQRATAHGLRRMLEEHTYFCSVWFRWGEDRAWPHMTRYFTETRDDAEGWLPMARKYMRKQLWQQGIARHDSDTILSRVKADIDAVSIQLGDQPFLLGGEPTSIDASAYGILEAILDSPWDAPEADYIRSVPNVYAYLERIRNRYWAEWHAEQEMLARSVAVG